MIWRGGGESVRKHENIIMIREEKERWWCMEAESCSDLLFAARLAVRNSIWMCIVRCCVHL